MQITCLKHVLIEKYAKIYLRPDGLYCPPRLTLCGRMGHDCGRANSRKLQALALRTFACQPQAPPHPTPTPTHHRHLPKFYFLLRDTTLGRISKPLGRTKERSQVREHLLEEAAGAGGRTVRAPQTVRRPRLHDRLRPRIRAGGVRLRLRAPLFRLHANNTEAFHVPDPRSSLHAASRSRRDRIVLLTLLNLLS